MLSGSDRLDETRSVLEYWKENDQRKKVARRSREVPIAEKGGESGDDEDGYGGDEGDDDALRPSSTAAATTAEFDPLGCAASNPSNPSNPSSSPIRKRRVVSKGI